MVEVLIAVLHCAPLQLDNCALTQMWGACSEALSNKAPGNEALSNEAPSNEAFSKQGPTRQ